SLDTGAPLARESPEAGAASEASRETPTSGPGALPTETEESPEADTGFRIRAAATEAGRGPATALGAPGGDEPAPSSLEGLTAALEAGHDAAESAQGAAELAGSEAPAAKLDDREPVVEASREGPESSEAVTPVPGEKPAPWKPGRREAAPEAPEVSDTSKPTARGEEPPLEDTSLEAWSSARHADEAPAKTAIEGASEPAALGSGPETPSTPGGAQDSTPAAAASSMETPPAGPIPLPAPHRAGTPSGPHPPLDDAELPELVVTEFKGPGPLRPAGLEHTRASADVHAAITPPAGTLIVTPLDEPPPEPPEKFQLDAPVRGDEPLHVPESSFQDVARALSQPGSGQERPTTPIPLLPSMETAAPDEMPVPPPPPLDEPPVVEEGAVLLEPGADLPKAAPPVEPPAPPAAEPPAPSEPTPAPVSLVPPIEAREEERPARPAPSAEETPDSPVRPAPVGTTELGIEINPESIRASWFHDGRSEPLVLDAVGGRHEVPVRLVREPGAPPRMLAPDAPEPALWVGAPLPFLGAQAGSDAARTVARRWPALVVPDDRGEAAFTLEGGTVGAGELVATLLRWVRHRAEEVTSHQAGRVVIAVPVAFNTVQRERLREAAERAGFEGVRLVQAPTAATMAFAHGRGLARRRILVFRMGASTCDIAVLAASGNDLDMVACGGDGSLGSANFDEQIALALDKA
ncbi:MAG TPA: Hsp70 family protein, partial [Myxococcaceae bacterium]|nr:Hsp70 family protein [Myxococcaceae bacterium]